MQRLTLGEPRTCQFDVLVVGAGGAGSAAAVRAAREGASVLLVSKDPVHCSDTKISEGNITVRSSGSAADTEGALAADLHIGGDDLAEHELTTAFAEDARSAYGWLRGLGLPAPTGPRGQPRALIVPMGGHTLARTVPHQNGGLDVGHALASAVQATSGVEVLEDAWCASLLLDHEGSVCGAMVYEACRGRWSRVLAKAVVLACGGLSTLYFPNTDTMRGNTGDAYALALRAGAALVDMEQVQFLPFGVAHPPSLQGLLAGEPVSAGPLGVLRDGEGRVIMDALMGRTRAECAAVIARTVAEGRGTPHDGCYLDLRDNARGESGAIFLQMLRDNADSVLATVKRAMGADAARLETMWEVRPTAHYCMGGVRATSTGQVLRADGAPVRGLFCAGQAMGGLHGSNRLGSTSLAEGTIFGRRAGHAAATLASSRREVAPLPLEASLLPLEGDHDAPLAVVRALQRAAWERLGPARTVDGLSGMGAVLTGLEARLEACALPSLTPWNQPLLDWLEGRNMLLVARSMHTSCTARDHSLGAHLLLDGKPTPSARYSVCTWLEAGQVRCKHLPRPRSARRQRLRVHLTQAAKITALKGLRLLPPDARDKLLLAGYRHLQRASAAASEDHP